MDIADRYGRVIRGLAGLLTGVAGFGFILSQVSVAAVLDAAAGLDLWTYLLGVPLLVVINGLMAYRWQQVLHDKDVDIAYLTAFLHQLEAGFVNAFMPARAGDIYKGYLAPGERATLDNTVLVLLERVVDMLVLLSLAALVLVSFFPHGGLFAYVGVGVLLLAGFGLGLTVVWRLEELPIGTGAELYARLRAALLENMRTDRWMTLIGTTVLIWMVAVLRHGTTIMALGIDAGLALVALIAFAWALVSAVPLTPAGLGAVDAAVYLILTSFGVPGALAGSYVLLTRVILQGFQLLTGGVLFLRRHGGSVVEVVR